MIAEQALIGVGNFVVSWTALRSLEVSAVASFALLWAIGWGAFAVLSESVISPIRVRALQDNDDSGLQSISWGAACLAMAGVLVALACGVAGAERAAAASASIAIPFAATAFFAARAASQATQTSGRTFFGCAAYAIGSVAFVTIASAVFLDPAYLISAAAFALIVGGAAMGRGRPTKKSVVHGLRLLPIQLWRGKLFAVSTSLRVVLYSVGLLAVIRAVQGDHAAALYAAALVLISPSQLLSSSLPWALLPRLAASGRHFLSFVHELTTQLAAYLVLAATAGLVLWLVWDFWIETSIHDRRLLVGIEGEYWIVVLLMVGVVLTSLSTSALQVQQAQAGHFVAVIVSGGLGLSIAASGGPVLVAAAAPYLLSFVIGAVWAIWKARNESVGG